MVIKKVAGLLCVRGGSKRLLRKNARVCDGLKLMEYPLIAMLGSEYIEKVFVSTDDDEMKEVARYYNVEVIDRPYQLACDIAADSGVKLHALKEIEERFGADYVVMANATHPMILSKYIDNAYNILRNHGSAYQIGAVNQLVKGSQLNNHVTLLPNGTILPIFRRDSIGVNVFITTRQVEVYFSNGMFGIREMDREYIKSITTPDLDLSIEKYIAEFVDLYAKMEQKRVNDGRLIEMGYLVDEYDAIDIHTIKDLKMAEHLLRYREEYEKEEIK